MVGNVVSISVLLPSTSLLRVNSTPCALSYILPFLYLVIRSLFAQSVFAPAPKGNGDTTPPPKKCKFRLQDAGYRLIFCPSTFTIAEPKTLVPSVGFLVL